MMALIKCPDCGKNVSSNAKSCLNCGCPIKSGSETIELLSQVVCYAVVAAAFIVYFVVNTEVSGFICCLVFTAGSIIPIFTARNKDYISIQILIAIICIICFIGFASVGFTW